MTPEQEKTLLDQVQSDPSRFGEFFDHYYKPVFGYVYRRVLHHDTARDIVAETFLKAFLHIKNFRWKGISLSSWFYRIATNEGNYYFRKKKYSPFCFQKILNHELISLKHHNLWDDEKERLERELKEHMDFVIVQEKLKELDIKYQAVIALRYFENKDIKTISDILNKPEGTIKSLLSRGLEKLRKKIQENPQPH
jgi:RNA polymerase sigma-70 factor, ECF subfamily